MEDKTEKLIKAVYKAYKANSTAKEEKHPDEETLACFIGNLLNPDETKAIKEHLIHCNFCAQALAARIKITKPIKTHIPKDLILKITDLAENQQELPGLNIILSIKDKIFELLDTNGDILVGQELMPAPLARSRQIKEFKNEITILKDFNGIRIEVKIENKSQNLNNLSIAVKNKQTSQLIKDLRIALLKNDLELESYVTDINKVVFDQILTGQYSIKIFESNKKLGAISLEIKA